MGERDKFENYVRDEYPNWSLQQSIAGYVLASVQTLWIGWQAHAALDSQQKPGILELLAMIYDKWENGVDCYEDQEDLTGYLGHAFKLKLEEEEQILSALKGHPVTLITRPAAQQKPEAAPRPNVPQMLQQQAVDAEVAAAFPSAPETREPGTPHTPMVEIVRREMMARFSDKLSMEEIASCAYAIGLAGERSGNRKLEELRQWIDNDETEIPHDSGVCVALDLILSKIAALSEKK